MPLPLTCTVGSRADRGAPAARAQLSGLVPQERHPRQGSLGRQRPRLPLAGCMPLARARLRARHLQHQAAASRVAFACQQLRCATCDECG
eukprot:3267624-Rhodomonas_salina.1